MPNIIPNSASTRNYAKGGPVDDDDNGETTTRRKKRGGGGRSKTFSDPDVQMIAALGGTQSETPTVESTPTPDLSANIEE